MNTAPEPIPRGIYGDISNGKKYHAFSLKHNADAGETEDDNCIITVPVIMEGGEHNCGETGIFPPDDFAKRFQFVGFPKPGQKF